jgi:hypothetical protein
MSTDSIATIPRCNPDQVNGTEASRDLLIIYSASENLRIYSNDKSLGRDQLNMDSSLTTPKNTVATFSLSSQYHLLALDAATTTPSWLRKLRE